MPNDKLHIETTRGAGQAHPSAPDRTLHEHHTASRTMPLERFDRSASPSAHRHRGCHLAERAKRPGTEPRTQHAQRKGA